MLNGHEVASTTGKIEGWASSGGVIVDIEKVRADVSRVKRVGGHQELMSTISWRWSMAMKSDEIDDGMRLRLFAK